MRTHLLVRSAALASAMLCSLSSYAQDGFGGSRDNGLVRHQVHTGLVPRPETFTVEGLLAEHHVPVSDTRCASMFCIHTAMGHGRNHADQRPAAWMVLEPVSGLVPDTHQRAPQNLAVVLDRSGSMTGWKFSSALRALHALIDRLGPNDRLSIVAFDHEASLVVPSTPVAQRAMFHRAVNELTVRGATNISAGLRMGFTQVRAHAGRVGVGDRVMLLTDAQPNVGDTSPGGFMELVGEFASQHIGLSLMGVGLDLGAELSRAMTQLRGGSAHYLEDADAIARLFGRDFDALVTPVATDLTITITPAPGLRVEEVLGVPGDDVVRDEHGVVTMRASTVFLDRRRSAVVLRLGATSDQNAIYTPSATVAWSYRLGTTGALTQGETTASHVARVPGSAAEFATPEHYRAYALVNFARSLQSSLSLWHRGRFEEAHETLTHARAALSENPFVANDTELTRERDLADNLSRLMRTHLDTQTQQDRSSAFTSHASFGRERGE